TVLAASPPAPAADSPTAAPAAGRKPNVVVILADDIGYGDLGCYGATKVRTPNVDRLATQGVRFTDAYAPSAVCTPSRFAMLTGLYAWRHPPASRILPGDAPMTIPAGRPTVASVLRDAGYATGLVGKWHLGLGAGKTDFNGEIKPGPLDVGFGSAYFIPATVDRVPTVWVDGRRVAGLDPADPITVSYQSKVGTEPTGKENPDQLKLKPSHGHDMTIVNGISRIGWMTGGTAARWTDEQIADVVATRAAAFIDANKDKPFFLYVATHDVHVPRTPGPRFAGKSPLGPRGDVIEEFDDTVGRVLAALDANKLADDTLVIVSSDNGGVIDDGYQDGAPEKLGDHKANGPLKGFKGSLYEGGLRVPFVARWPRRTGQPGRTSGEVVSLVDVPAIAAAAAGVELPKAGFEDAVNVLPALAGDGKGRDSLVLHSGGPAGLAVRQGRYKLIPPRPAAAKGKKAGGGGGGGGEGGGGYGAGPMAVPQVYDVVADSGETMNLAAEKPDVVAALTAVLEAAKSASPPRTK
ncbi:MAG: arylsulfatase, partial [Phycisphaerales bacterium]|nr:arylsulfatase [Phycisphaerales bacterium]